MSTRARLQNSNDSKSLWNYTLSPGWGAFDAHILRLAVMRYGCGAWKDINRHFPLKTCGQLNLQTQRLFGQQALAEFNKLHIDPRRVAVINDAIDGFRKNSCLINTGNNLTAEQRGKRQAENKQKFGIPKELYEQIQVPVVLDAPVPCKTVIDRIEKLREMYRAVYDIQLRLKHLRANNGNNAANIAVKAKQQNKSKNKSKSNTESKKAAPQEKKDEEDVQMANTNDGSNTNNKEPAKENVDSDVEITAVVEQSDKAAKATDSDVELVKVVPAEPAVDTETETETEPQPAVTAAFEPAADMDEETAMALALSASMAEANINTPAVEKKARSQKGTKSKKKKSAKKSTSKKKKNGKSASGKKKNKSSRKRKVMDSDSDAAYVPPQPAKKRVKTK